MPARFCIADNISVVYISYIYMYGLYIYIYIWYTYIQLTRFTLFHARQFYSKYVYMCYIYEYIIHVYVYIRDLKLLYVTRGYASGSRLQNLNIHEYMLGNMFGIILHSTFRKQFGENKLYHIIFFGHWLTNCIWYSCSDHYFCFHYYFYFHYFLNRIGRYL